MGEALNLAILLTIRDEASKHLDNIGEKLGGVGKAAVALGGAAVAGIGALAAGLWDAAQAAGQEEIGISRLAAAVRATGSDWSAASARIEEYIAAQMRRAALDDGDARDALTRLTTATGDYNRALELLPLAMDLARGKNIDLAAASDLVGRVAEGNVGILGRYGITLHEGATATEALAALQERFAGQAEAYGNTFAGAQDKARIALGNLKETIGAVVLPVLTSLFVAIADVANVAIPWVENAVAQLMPVFQQAFGWVQANVVPILAAIVTWVRANWPSISAQITDVMRDVWNVISRVLTAIKSAWNANFLGIQGITRTIFETIKNTVKNGLEVVRGVIQVITSLIRGDWEGVWTGMKRIAEALWNQIRGTVVGAAQIMRDLLSGIWTAILRAANTAWDAMKTNLTTRATQIKTAISGTFEGLRDRVAEIWNGIKSAIKAPLNAIIEMINTFIRAWNAIEIRIPGFNIQLPSVTIAGQTIGGGTLGWSGATIGTPDIPTIPALAQGGIVTRPTLVMAGEAGPEAIIPLRQNPGFDPAAAREYASAARALISAIDQLVRVLGGTPRGEDMLREFELRARLAS